MSYWDLSEKERANLTREGVEKYIAFELMRAGVLQPAELVLVEEPETPEAEGEVFVAQCGYQHSEIAFASPDDARRSINGALGQLKTEKVGDWRHGVKVSKVVPFDLEANAGDLVRRVPIYSDERLAAVKEQLDKAAEAKSENGRRKEAHSKEAAKVDEALKGMWADWHECRAKAAEMKRVHETLAKYVEMAKGDEEIARGFLIKAFDADIVEEAEGWVDANPNPA